MIPVTPVFAGQWDDGCSQGTFIRSGNTGPEDGHRPATTTKGGCIHQFDRVSQYCSYDYQNPLYQHHFKVSMSGEGNCYDNAVVETFFRTIMAELTWRPPWQTRRAVELAIFAYINWFYNPCRHNSALGWKKPSRIRTESAPIAHLGRHKTVTGSRIY